MKLIFVLVTLSTVLAAVIPELQQPIVKDESTRCHEAPPGDDFCLQTNGEGDHENNTLRISTIIDPKDLDVDPRSQQYSGYLNLATKDRQLFFWMFMSRNDPARDPVVLWLNGGPGCSSLYGALTQWGPKLVNGEGELVENQHTLIERATFIFLDQPVGVGFSWSSNAKEPVTTTPEATADVVEFLQLFFDTDFLLKNGIKVNLRSNEFHIAGESFAGHYVPNVARTLLQANGEPNARQIKLTSVIIGNGFTDALLISQAIYQMVCNPDLNTRWKLPDAECTAVSEKHLKQCNKLITDCRIDKLKCRYVEVQCIKSSAQTLANLLRRDRYDLTKELGKDDPRNDVEKDGGTLEVFLKESRDALGVTLPSETLWKICSKKVFTAFYDSGDHSKNYVPDLEALLASENVLVLLYAGDTDLTVPFLSVKETAKSIQWAEQNVFNQHANLPETELPKLKDAAEDVYGSYVRASRLMYARIYGAGHMVNENKAPQAKDMFYKWLFNEKF